MVSPRIAASAPTDETVAHLQKQANDLDNRERALQTNEQDLKQRTTDLKQDEREMKRMTFEMVRREHFLTDQEEARKRASSENGELEARVQEQAAEVRDLGSKYNGLRRFHDRAVEAHQKTNSFLDLALTHHREQAVHLDDELHKARRKVEEQRLDIIDLNGLNAEWKERVRVLEMENERLRCLLDQPRRNPRHGTPDRRSHQVVPLTRKPTGPLPNSPVFRYASSTVASRARTNSPTACVLPPSGRNHPSSSVFKSRLPVRKVKSCIAHSRSNGSQETAMSHLELPPLASPSHQHELGEPRWSTGEQAHMMEQGAKGDNFAEPVASSGYVDKMRTLFSFVKQDDDTVTAAPRQVPLQRSFSRPFRDHLLRSSNAGVDAPSHIINQGAYDPDGETTNNASSSWITRANIRHLSDGILRRKASQIRSGEYYGEFIPRERPASSFSVGTEVGGDSGNKRRVSEDRYECIKSKASEARSSALI